MLVKALVYLTIILRCRWALVRGLDADRGTSAVDEAMLKQHKLAGHVLPGGKRSPDRIETTDLNPATGLPQVLGAPDANMSMTTLVSVLPCGKSDAERLARRQLFVVFDADDDGYLSLEDIDAGLQAVLEKKRASGRLSSEPTLPAVRLAFEAVTKSQGGGVQLVSQADFRLLFTYLKWYMTSLHPFPSRKSARAKRVDKLPPIGHASLNRSDRQFNTLFGASSYMLSAPNRSAGLRDRPRAEEHAFAMRARSDATGTAARKLEPLPIQPRYATF